jgi:hypothetical protein
MSEMSIEVTPEVNTTATPEPTPDTEVLQKTEKKERRLEQLRAAREAKKLKQAMKAKEDSEIRTALLALKKENKELKSTRKRSREEEEPEEQNKKRPRVPVVVTKQDDDEDEVESGPSFKAECAKVAIVSTLALASFYVKNRMFQKQNVQPRSENKATKNTKTQRVVPNSRATNASILFNQTKNSGHPVGKSGFTTK